MCSLIHLAPTFKRISPHMLTKPFRYLRFLHRFPVFHRLPLNRIFLGSLSTHGGTNGQRI